MAAQPYDKEQLCSKIKEIFPDIGICGIDVAVDFDEEKGTYVIDMMKDGRKVKTYLEPDDATLCMSGKQCVNLGIQIGQVKD